MSATAISWDKSLAMSLQALNAAHWVAGTGLELVFQQSHANIPGLNYQKTTSSDETTAEAYERFCMAIETLAAVLGKSCGEDVEILLLSSIRWRHLLVRKCFPRASAAA